MGATEKLGLARGETNNLMGDGEIVAPIVIPMPYRQGAFRPRGFMRNERSALSGGDPQVTSPNPLVALKAALTSFYKLDEASGTRADQLAYGSLAQTGTLLAATACDGSGNSAFCFANTQYLQDADASHYDPGASSFSVFCWFKMAARGGNNVLCGRGTYVSAATTGWMLDVGDDAGYGFILYEGSSVLAQHAMNSISTGDCHLICAKRDTDVGVIAVSLDGVSFQTTACGAGTVNATSSKFRVFQETGSGTYPMLGTAEGLGLAMGYAMTDAQAAALWNGGTPLAWEDWPA